MAATAQFTIRDTDYVAASRANALLLLRQWRTWRRAALAMAIIATAMVLGIGIFDGDWLAAAITGLVGIVGGAVVVALLTGLNFRMLPRRARRLFAQQRVAHYPQTIVWDDAGISWRSAIASLNTPWPDLHGWHEAHDTFLLFLNEQLPQFVPKAALSPEQADDLRATLVAHGPPRR